MDLVLVDGRGLLVSHAEPISSQYETPSRYEIRVEIAKDIAAQSRSQLADDTALLTSANSPAVHHRPSSFELP